ncbi:MAG: cation:proton antiporter [Bacilli bacterium]|nr:cation:proton antiporter [Bacilli bacterium]
MFLSHGLVTEFFIPIIILLGFATIASVLLKLFKLDFLPVFAIEILIGLLIANWFNGYMESLHLTSVVEGLYVLGLSLIIFMGGYEVEFDIADDLSINEENDCRECKHNKCWKCKYINVLKVALILTIFSYIAALIVSIALNSFIVGDKTLGIIILTLVFASTFAGLVVPILHEKGLIHTAIGKTLSTIADLSEALSIIFLTILMIIVDLDRQYWYIIALIALTLVTFGVFRKYRVGNFFGKFTEGVDHLATRVVIIIALVFVLLSNLAGGEYILGAFMAGIFVRRAKFSTEIMHSLERIIYGIFAPMFYILVGTQIDIVAMFSSWESIRLVLLLAAALLIVELPVLYLLRWYNWKTVIPSVVLMSCTIIVPIAARELNHSLHLFTDEFAQALILASLIICILGTIFFATRFPFSSLKKNEKEIVHE